MGKAGPLAGVRVIDLTSNIMGPYASLLLADMGADVCKVESPDGDLVRNVGPARHPGMSGLFLNANRNKRGMVLDLKHPDGAAALKRMLARADVLLFSLRAKAMARLGLAYADVQAINPRLIYCGAYGYGQQGPYADKPAYDDLIQAAVGLPILQARKTGEPQYVASPLADRVVGMATCNAVAMALYHREKTGRGQSVEVPMLETFAQFLMGDHLWGHTFSPPIGDWGYARMMDARRRPFRTRDGYISLHMVTDRHWARFFDAIGRADMAHDARYADVKSRGENLGELYGFLGETLAGGTNAQWLALFEKIDVAAMPMNTPETLLADPHMRAVGFFKEVEHPTEGPIRQIGIAATFSDSPPQQRHPAPRLGEHTLALLADYGFSDDEARALVASGAARQAQPAGG